MFPRARAAIALSCGGGGRKHDALLRLYLDREPKVGELGDERLALGRDQHVLGLDVTVHHVQVAQVAERECDLVRFDSLIERSGSRGGRTQGREKGGEVVFRTEGAGVPDSAGVDEPSRAPRVFNYYGSTLSPTSFDDSHDSHDSNLLDPAVAERDVPLAAPRDADAGLDVGLHLAMLAELHRDPHEPQPRDPPREDLGGDDDVEDDDRLSPIRSSFIADHVAVRSRAARAGGRSFL